MKDCNNCKHHRVNEICFGCTVTVDVVRGRGTPSMWEADEGYEEDKNPYWGNICAMAHKQRRKGMYTYGQGLEDNPLTIRERLEYLEEELIDGLMYIEHIKAKLIELGGDTDG